MAATSRTWVFATFVNACQVYGTVGIDRTLGTTIRRPSNKGWHTLTNGLTICLATNWILTTWWWCTRIYRFMHNDRFYSDVKRNKIDGHAMFCMCMCEVEVHKWQKKMGTLSSFVIYWYQTNVWSYLNYNVQMGCQCNRDYMYRLVNDWRHDTERCIHNCLDTGLHIFD